MDDPQIVHLLWTKSVLCISPVMTNIYVLQIVLFQSVDCCRDYNQAFCEEEEGVAKVIKDEVKLLYLYQSIEKPPIVG